MRQPELGPPAPAAVPGVSRPLQKRGSPRSGWGDPAAKGRGWAVATDAWSQVCARRPVTAGEVTLVVSPWLVN